MLAPRRYDVGLLSFRYLLAAKRYRGGMTVRGSIKISLVIPLRVSGIYVKRYRE
ncbi:hypothetical protein [Wolbachia pipientis]|uniref:hypothetical protein n=1 Tax=Wolbachia pipientis TaxID=955 RepID=UPI0015CFAEA8|nr:hypothetical protein [Wolbachia pipientis]